MFDKIKGIFHKKDRTKEREIYEKHYIKVYKTAFFIVKDQGLAQDITQETFIKAFKNMDTLQNQEKMESWITTIATRTSIDFLRKQKKGNENLEEDVEIIKGINKSEDNPSNHLNKEEINEKLRIEMKKLKPEYREILLLKYMNDMTDEEIAKEINEKVGTVKSRLHRAKQQLKKNLQQGGDIS